MHKAKKGSECGRIQVQEMCGLCFSGVSRVQHVIYWGSNHETAVQQQKQWTMQISIFPLNFIKDNKRDQI